MLPNPDYIAAADLQEYLADKATAQAMAGGTVTAYADNNRSQLKSLYRLTGSPGSYSFLPLPNPLSLGANGTTVDGGGNYVVPYYLPFDVAGNAQLYYLQIANSGGTQQYVLQAWPPNATGTSPEPTTTTTQINYVPNGMFFFNNPTTGPVPFNYVASVGASQGLVDSAWDNLFQKDSGSTALDSLTFPATTPGVPLVANYPVPPFVLSYNCTTLSNSETFKQIRIPISADGAFLAGTTVSISIVAKSSSLSTIGLSWYQNFGIGAGTSPVTTALDSFTLTSSYAVYTFHGSLPSAFGVSSGAFGGEEATLLVTLPINAICNIQLTMVQILPGDTDQVYINETTQEVGGRLFSPRTGSIQEGYIGSLPGWISMNNGTIGNSSSNATAYDQNDSYPLFDILWTNLSRSYTSIFNSNGTVGTFGGSSSADYLANKAIQLPSTFNAVLGQSNPMRMPFLNTTFTGSAAADTLTLGPYAANLMTGDEVQVAAGPGGTLPTGLTAATTYYVIPDTGTAIQVAMTLADAIAGTQINLTTNGSGTLFITSEDDYTSNLGGADGQAAGTHLQLIAEMAKHDHTATTTIGTVDVGGNTSQSVTLAGSGTTIPTSAGTITATTVVDDTPSIINTGFNIIQPTSYVLRYIKI